MDVVAEPVVSHGAGGEESLFCAVEALPLYP